MKIELHTKCPMCGLPMSFEIDTPNKGYSKTEPCFKCSCGCEGEMKVKIDINSWKKQ